MKSATPKVLHELGGRSLLGHAIYACQELQPDHLAVVVGHGRDQVTPELAHIAVEAVAVVQERQLGTGHAVMCALEALPALDGVVVVTYADVPLLTGETLHELVDRHVAHGSGVTVLTADVPDPTGYGRIVREGNGDVREIIEHKDASDDIREIHEINSGIYAFDADVLRSALKHITTDNAQGEMYLTDVVALARADGRHIGAHRTSDVWQTEGVNDRVQLASLRRELNRRVTEHWMREGVTIIDPESAWIDVTAELERDALLHPNVQLHGETRVGEGAKIGPDVTLSDTSVGAGASVVRAHCVQAEIGDHASVGPFAYLRPGAKLGARSKVGASVEVKASEIKDGAKVPHLTYVGDATVGEGVNIGAGTIIANYDGVEKHRTVIGAHTFVGSNSVLVAPLELADGSYIAAGSAVVSATEPGDLAVARGKQRNVAGWVRRKRAGTRTAAAAEAAASEQRDVPEGQAEAGMSEGDQA
jgi:bifunctional UDP-N-acetylglucosamine pyrophosphorylase/glucosamine-1-phosphate N-acetyltransferase